MAGSGKINFPVEDEEEVEEKKKTWKITNWSLKPRLLLALLFFHWLMHFIFWYTLSIKDGKPASIINKKPLNFYIYKPRIHELGDDAIRKTHQLVKVFEFEKEGGASLSFFLTLSHNIKLKMVFNTFFVDLHWIWEMSGWMWCGCGG